jgi:hypothetical protein
VVGNGPSELEAVYRSQMERVDALVTAFLSGIELLVRDRAQALVRAVLGRTNGDVIGGRPIRARGATAAVRATRLRQGQYLGLLRGLRGKAKRQIQTIARTEGVAAALRAGRNLRR